MTATPASPSVALSAALLSVDLVYRKHDYRLAEPEREDGHARVTYLSSTSLPMECSACGRSVKHGSRLVLFGIYGYHPACAIRVGALVHMPRCQEQDDIDAAYARSDASAERMRALDAAREEGIAWA